MPNAALVTELGAKAETFQVLLNTSKIPGAVARGLLPSIAPQDLFVTADSRIFVRSRPIIPFDQQDVNDTSIVQKVDGFRDCVLMAPKVSVSGQCSIDASRIALDGVFVGAADTTDDVYAESCAPLLALSVGGASTCVLCYGQTGSGKTYTTSGLMKRFAADIDPYLSTHTISMAVVEIQSQGTVDLINNAPNVQVVEDPSGEIQLLGCKEFPIESRDQMLSLIGLASSARTTKATGRNETSSRSHMIVRLRIVPRQASWSKPGFLFVADLAGSENTADSATHDKTRQQEAKFINMSLMTLKDCIRARALSGSSDGKHLHIPFRQSSLTLILRDCFELTVRRPTKTVVIACVSPLLRDARHTMGTLRYASLLAVSPPPVVAALSPDDPNGWTRQQALDFLVQASRGRLSRPELVLTEGDGRALVHIPEADFVSRITSTHPAITEKSAKVIYTEVWKAVVDARTKTRQALKGGGAPVKKSAAAAGPVLGHLPSGPASNSGATDKPYTAVSGRQASVPSSSRSPAASYIPKPVGKENLPRQKRPLMTEAEWRLERESGWSFDLE